MSKQERHTSWWSALLHFLLHLISWVLKTSFLVVAIVVAYLAKLAGSLLHTIGERIEEAIHK